MGETMGGKVIALGQQCDCPCGDFI